MRGRAARQAAIAQPTRARAVARDRARSAHAARAGSSGGRRKRDQALRCARERMCCNVAALRRARQDAATSKALGARRGAGGERAPATSSSSSQSGFSSTVTSWRARATPALQAAPKPRLPLEHDHLGAGARRERGAVVGEPESTATSLGVGGQVAPQRAGSSAASSGAESCRTVTIVKLTRRRVGEQRVQGGGRASPGVAAARSPRGGAQRARARPRRRRCQQGIGERAGVAGRDAAARRRPSVSREDGRSLTTAGVPWAAPPRAGARSPRGRTGDHGQRAGVERRRAARGVDRARGRSRCASRPSTMTTLGVEAAGAGAREWAAARTPGALRGSRAPTNSRVGRACARRGGRRPRGARGASGTARRVTLQPHAAITSSRDGLGVGSTRVGAPRQPRGPRADVPRALVRA